MRKLLSVATAVVLGVGLTMLIHPLAEADVSSLTTSPVSINLDVKPGSSVTTTLQVMNNGVSPINISVQLETFSAYGQTGQAKIIPAPANDPSTNYVSFSKKTILAQPGVWEPVKMTINLPVDASLGYYYAVLFKPELPSTAAGKQVTLLKSANAVLVLVDSRSTNERRSLSLSSFISLQGLYEYLPATFRVTVHNNGNIFLAPEGNIYISRSSNFHSDIATLNINQGLGNVLPGSNRVFSAAWSDGFPVYQPKLVDGQPLTKNGKPVEQLSWNFSKLSHLRFGKYYAQVTLVYSNGQRDIPITSVVSFWVIPWTLIIVGILVPTGLIAAGWYLGHVTAKRRFRNKGSKQIKRN